jgi:hypothetical protein
MAQVSTRTLAVPVVIALLLVACSSSDSKSSRTASAAPGAQAASTTIVIGPDGSSSVVVVPSPTAPGEPTTVPGGDGGSPSASLDSTGPPGSFAPGILSPAHSSQIVVEVRTQPNAGPRQSTIDHVTSVLSNASGKSVAVAQGAGIGGGAKGWSADELRTLADQGAPQGGGSAVIHLLFVHGSFGGDDSVLGVALRGDTAAIFPDQVDSASTPLVGSGGIEVAVVTHEVGHILGLVDLLLHTGRQDPDHPGHSTNSKSVMFWAVESNLVADLLQGGPPKDFDRADLADLQTIRNSG